jgi:YceI-like domain
MMTKSRIVASFLALGAGLSFASGPAHGQTQAAKKTATPALPAKMEADLDSSRVYIKVTSGSRLGHDHGVAGKLESGWVKPGTNGQLVFAMRTFITDTPEARKYVGLTAPIKAADQQKSSANMLGVDVLNVQRYAHATFDIKSFDPAEGQAAGAPGLYQLGGTFTLHGVARPLALRAKLEPTTDPTVSRLRGSFAIKQSAYGITPYSALGGMVSIEDKLDIWGDFVLRTPAPQAAASAPKVTR